MALFKNLKRFCLLALALGIFSIGALHQSANACTLVTTPTPKLIVNDFNPIDDIYVKSKGIKQSTYDTDYLLTANDHGIVKAVSYLKFDISSLKSKGTVYNAQLKLAGHVTGQSDSVDNNIAVYFVSNNTWTEAGKFNWVNRPKYLESDKITEEGNAFGSYYDELYTWNLSGFDFTKYLANGNSYFAVALQDNSTALKDVDPDDDALIETEYNSRNKHTGRPVLELSTASPIGDPAPEPSGIVLGLMSLGGFIASRKKINK